MWWKDEPVAPTNADSGGAAEEVFNFVALVILFLNLTNAFPECFRPYTERERGIRGWGRDSKSESWEKSESFSTSSSRSKIE